MRNGEYVTIVKNRNKTMLEAKRRNPQRWSRSARQLPEEHIVYLNPSAETMISTKVNMRKVA